MVSAKQFTRCKAPSKDEESKLIAKPLKRARAPGNASALVAAVDAALSGKEKVAGQKDEVKDGKLKGKITLASAAAETFLMQLGAGLPVGWGKVVAAEMYDLQRMHVYDWSIDRRSKGIEKAKRNTMLAAIVAALGEKGNATTVFLGHDTDLNGIGTQLDLGWAAQPFPDNTTAPNVALKFSTGGAGEAGAPADRAAGGGGGSVSVVLVYTRFETAEGALLRTALRTESAKKFCERAAAAVDEKCAAAEERAVREKTFYEFSANTIDNQGHGYVVGLRPQ